MIPRYDGNEGSGGSIKKDAWLAFLTLANWAAILIILPRLPDRIPMHWNAAGTVDRWGNRANLIWLGALGPAIWGLMTLLPGVDPGKKNYAKFAGTYRVLRAALVAAVSALAWVSIAAAADSAFNAVFLIKLLLGILFTVVGGLMARIRPNRFTGIKTPWTLADPVIWKKTHRLAGVLMAGGGLAFLLSALFLSGRAGIGIPITVIAGGVAVDIVYSAILWKRRHPGESSPRRPLPDSSPESFPEEEE